MRTKLFCCVAFLIAATCQAAPLSTQWDGSTLEITWGDGDDFARFTEEAGNLAIINDFFGTAAPLMSDAGDFIPVADIASAFLRLGGGSDTAYEPALPTVVTLGGDGNDFLYGGPAAVGELYGEGGDDYLVAGTGVKLLDGGAGSNDLNSSHNPFGSVTFVYHAGSNDLFYDAFSTNTTYILSSEPSPTIGTLEVFEYGGEDDLLRTNGRDFDVTGNTIVSDFVTGHFYGWNGIEAVDRGPTIVVSEPEPRALVLLLIGLAILAANWRRRCQ